MNGSGSTCGSPSAAAAAGSGWRQSGVLGDAYRPSHGGASGQSIGSGRRAVSASAVGIGGAGARSRTRLPRTPRPARTLQIFNSVKQGLQESIQVIQDEITRLREIDLPPSSPTCQPRHIEIEKNIKQADRQKKRLEFHLFKLEELEESYVLHQQLREGVKTMAKAFISHSGSSKKLSIQNVERGHKECIQTMCLIEAQLESLLGSFHCAMTGLSGFARLIPGDTCIMRLRYGAQKWKSRGKIGESTQTWDPKTVELKALVGEDFAVKVVEVKSLGKNVLIGEKILEAKQLFSYQPQVHSISLNTTGSVRLNLQTHWIPLDAIDDSMALFAEVTRRPQQLGGGGTPRKQLPIRSMIECETQPLLYWQKFRSSSSFPSSNASRFSVPMFPADIQSISSSSGVAMPAGSSSSGELPVGMQQQQQQQHSTEDIGRNADHHDDRCTRPQYRHSMYVIPSQSAGKTAFPKTVTVNAGIAEGKGPFLSTETVPITSLSAASTGEIYVGNSVTTTVTPVVARKTTGLLQLQQQQQRHDATKASNSLLNLLSNLQIELHHHRGDESSSNEALTQLSDQVDRLTSLLQMHSVRRLSDESNSIETVLEAFSFLESVDYEGDAVEDDTSDDEDLTTSKGPLRSSRRLFGASSMNTTDSGIGSIANREQTRERRSRSDSRILGSRGLAELSTAAMLDGAATGIDQLDVALRWHITYCTQLAKELHAGELHARMVGIENELESQGAIFVELGDLVSTNEIVINTLPSAQASSDDVINFWLDCCGECLYCSRVSFIATLNKYCTDKLPSLYSIADSPEYVNTVFEAAVADVVGCLSRTAASGENVEESFLNQTVTLHQFLFYLRKHHHDTVESFLNKIVECTKVTAN